MPSSFIDKLKKVDPKILSFDETPFVSILPPFPWKDLGKKLADLFELKTCSFYPEKIEWIEDTRAFTSFIPLAFSLSSVKGCFFLFMQEQEVSLLMSLLLTQSTKKIDLEENEYVKGFYRFAALEILQKISELKFLGPFSPLLLQETKLPEGPFLKQEIVMEIEEKSLKAYLLFPPEFQKSFKEEAKKKSFFVPSDEIVKETPIQLHLEIGKIKITKKEWEKVEKNDFLLLDSCSLEDNFTKGRVILNLEGRPIFRAKLKEGSIKILEYPIFHEENTMSQFEDDDEETDFEEEETDFEEEDDDEEWEEEGEDEDEEDIEKEDEEEEEETKEEKTPSLKKESIQVEKESASTTLSRIEEVPLTIVAEIGYLKLSIKELMSLEPGKMLEIDIHPENGVDLTVEGKCIAKAELIQIGDSLGVRILDIA